MERQRELIRTLNVGKYSFDIKVNRQIALDAFKKYPNFWKAIAAISKNGISETDIEDVNTVSELLENNDIIADEKPDFAKYVLQKMVEAADANVDTNEFISYCIDNDVEDVVFEKIVEFALMGFTGGKGAKKPKVKVTLE